MIHRRLLAAAALGCLLFVCPEGCATDADETSGFTSTGVLDDSGTNLDKKPTSNSNNTAPNAQSTLAPYPTRDSGLYLLSNSAWQTFLQSHWGNLDWVTTSYDYAHILDALAVNIEVNSGRRYAGFAEAAFNRVAVNMYAYNNNTDTLDEPAFMAFGLARLYNVTAGAPVALPNRAQYLTQAVNFLAPVQAGESTDGNNTSLGLFIDAAQSARHTSVNGAAILAALEIYRANNDSGLVTFAKRIYAAWLKAAVNGNFLVANAIASDGTSDVAPYTYNYGLMIGGAVALHRITGEAHYLQEARGMATKLLATMTTQVSSATVLVEPQCTSSACGAALVHRGLTLRALANLAAIDPNNAAVQAVLNGTASLLAKNRNAQDGHWPVNWAIAGPTTLDPAADLGAALALAYLAQSAPSQCPPAPSGWTSLATDSGLAVNLPINPGADNVLGWATVGPFASTALSLRASIFSPIAGAANLMVRYAVPDTSSPGLALTLSPDGSTPTITLTGTTSAHTMAQSASVPINLVKGLNTVAINAQTLPANILVDGVTVAPQKNVSGATCSPQNTLTQVSPLAGARLCGATTFTWKGGSPSRGQSDVIVDGAVMCTVRGAAQTCTLTQSLSHGRHTWAVLEDGCSLSATEAFDVSQAAPVKVQAQVSVAGSSTTLSWPSQSVGQAVDVTLNGTLVCGKVLSSGCVMPTSLLKASGANQATFAAGNFCGVVSSTQVF